MHHARTDDVAAAEIVREYGPFADAPRVNGVSFDGSHVWFASGETLYALDPASGRRVRSINVVCDAGTVRFAGRPLGADTDSFDDWEVSR